MDECDFHTGRSVTDRGLELLFPQTFAMCSDVEAFEGSGVFLASAREPKRLGIGDALLLTALIVDIRGMLRFDPCAGNAQRLPAIHRRNQPRHLTPYPPLHALGFGY